MKLKRYIINLSIGLVILGATAIVTLRVMNMRDALFGVTFAAIVIFIAAVDIDRFEIPDLANLAIFVLGFTWQANVVDIDIRGLAEPIIRCVLMT